MQYIVEDLVRWCQGQDVEVDGVYAAAVEQGERGLVANKTLEQGECFLSVPSGLLMTVESAYGDSKLLRALGGLQLSSQQVLAAHLLHELSKDAASRWRPYLQTLPPAFTTAACFGDADADALQVAGAVAAAHRARQMAQEQWQGALPVLRALGLPARWRCRAAWLWATSVLSSRTMYLPGDSAGALTPFGDFANYEAPPPPFLPHLAPPPMHGHTLPAVAAARGGGVGGADEEGIAGDGRLVGERYCLFAGRRYAAGEQVFLCYGRHTNLELLLYYGFVLPGNSHDTAALPLSALPPEAAAQLGAAGGCHVCAGGAPSWELLRALRLACASREERRRGAQLVLADGPLGAACERRAVGALRQACASALAGLPTSVAEDEDLLLLGGGAAGAQLSPCARVAVEWRLGHKRLLCQCIANCDSVLKGLHPGPAEAMDFVTWRGSN